MGSDNSPQNVFSDIFPPRDIRILGAGRFGRMAAERLRRRFPEVPITVTDSDAEKVAQVGAADLGLSVELGESLKAITERVLPEEVWVIPAVPVHVGYEWVMDHLSGSGRTRRLPVPEGADSFVPNPMRSPAGQTLYASFATTICPDYCSEPGEICTKTGKARLGNLFDVFAKIRLPGFGTAVLRSWQLAPGVGGYPVRSLNELLAKVESEAGKYLICTGCRCHGVVDALEWS